MMLLAALCCCWFSSLLVTVGAKRPVTKCVACNKIIGLMQHTLPLLPLGTGPAGQVPNEKPLARLHACTPHVCNKSERGEKASCTLVRWHARTLVTSLMTKANTLQNVGFVVHCLLAR
jgi:hypothetical protein